MRQQVNLITLGVKDLDDSVAFFDRLGWEKGTGGEDYAVYQAAGILVFLHPETALAKEVGGEVDGFGPSFLALNVESEAAVDAEYAAALEAGARAARPPEKQFWGGYSGVFADPSGHYWEIAYNPQWTPDADGIIRAYPAKAS
ncbi:MAG: VOC family protein [Euryhalocaulis sp.]|uniref:VOC family protein n=1 Tax=Euryhalocaulis sp. TaxID=2744307 RepID=UPI0017B38773|nr:VOC family protein [Euryhalocaulis sp.]MBA4802405.1 VOC family protein [Euryhalocaulis sp.]